MSKKVKIITAISIFLVAIITTIFVLNINKKYIITFDSNGGTEIIAQEVKKNDVAVKPSNPIKEGFNFKGWYLNNNKYDFSQKVIKSFKLKAMWEKKKM